MAYIYDLMIEKTNIQPRRLICKNFNSFGKVSCRTTVTSRTCDSSLSPFLLRHNVHSSCTSKAIRKDIKIHFRTFKNRKSCFLFKKKLQKKFFELSDKNLKIYRNMGGTKIRYFYVDKN